MLVSEVPWYSRWCVGAEDLLAQKSLKLSGRRWHGTGSGCARRPKRCKVSLETCPQKNSSQIVFNLPGMCRALKLVLFCSRSSTIGLSSFFTPKFLEVCLFSA